MATGTEGVGAGGNAFITSLNPAALRAYVCAMESGMIGNIWSPTAVGSPNVLSPSATLVAQPNRSNPNTHRPAATNAPCGNNADDSKPKRSRAPVRRCDSASAAEVSHVVVGAADPGAAPPSLGRSRTNTEAPRIVTRSQISPPPSLGTTVAAAAGKSRTTARSHNRTRSVSCIQSSGLEFHFPLSLAQGGAQGGAHGGAQGRAHEVITSPPAGPGLSAARNAVTAANDGKVKLTRALTEREGASGGSSGSGGSGAGSSAAGSRREFIRSRTASERVGNFDNSLSPRATTRSRSPKSFVASPEAQRAPPLPARSSQGSAMAPPAPSAARGFPDLYPDCGNTDGSPRDPLRKSDSDASVDDLYPSPGAVFPRFATIGDVSCAEGLDTVGNDNVNGNAKAKKKLHPALSRRSRSAGSQSAAALAASMGIERGAAVTGADVGGSGGSRTGPPVVQLAPRMGFVDWAGIGSPKTAGTVGGTSFGVSSGGASGGGGGSGASKLRLQPLDSSKSPSSPSPSPRFPVAIPSPSAASQLPAGFTPGSRSLPPYSAGAPPLSPLGRAGAAIVPRPTHRRAISAAQLSPRVPSPSARLVRPPSSPSVAGKAPGASAPLNAAAGAGGTSRSASASASVPAIARSSPRARIVQSATAPSSAAREATAEDGGAYAESTCATVNRAGKPMPRSMSAEPVLAHPVALEAQAAQTKQNHVGQPQPQPQQQQQLQGSSREHVGNYRRAAPTPLAVPSRRRNSMSSMPQGDAASKSALAGLAAANGGVRIGSARGQGSPGAGAWPARSPVGTAGGRLEGTSGEVLRPSQRQALRLGERGRRFRKAYPREHQAPPNLQRGSLTVPRRTAQPNAHVPSRPKLQVRHPHSRMQQPG
ncbi:unnamed protein product [Closterium sp. Yama58-4]|nr:unnamed protein product [Closterium sp. Yama58-4]